MAELLDRDRQYLRTVRPREPVEPVVRFETPAGRQGQVDVGTFRLEPTSPGVLCDGVVVRV